MPLSLIAQPATVMCEHPVDFAYRDGLVYVSDPALGVLRVFRPHTFYRSFHNAAQCMQDCHAEQVAEVIAFPARDAG